MDITGTMFRSRFLGCLLMCKVLGFSCNLQPSESYYRHYPKTRGQHEQQMDTEAGVEACPGGGSLSSLYPADFTVYIFSPC